MVQHIFLIYVCPSSPNFYLKKLLLQQLATFLSNFTLRTFSRVSNLLLPPTFLNLPSNLLLRQQSLPPTFLKCLLLLKVFFQSFLLSLITSKGLLLSQWSLPVSKRLPSMRNINVSSRSFSSLPIWSYIEPLASVPILPAP